MATLKTRYIFQRSPKLSHEERTADSLRNATSHVVAVNSVTQVNPTIRLLYLRPLDESESINFLPGQWLDVFVPGVHKAGGFTVTSAPHAAQHDPSSRGKPGYLELAIQRSPNNPPAAWLWRPEIEVVGRKLTVRVGGEFVWPPPLSGKPSAEAWNQSPTEARNVVLVAGGVGINPLISILTHLHATRTPLRTLTLLYATKTGAHPAGTDILFLPRIRDLAATFTPTYLATQIFATPAAPSVGATMSTPRLAEAAVGLPVFNRRLTPADVELALPAEEAARAATVCYICGPRAFTDGLVDAVGGMGGMHWDRVLCEKWW